MFETHAADDLARIRGALSESNLPEVHTAAHSIKGASGSLNLWRIYEAASTICSCAHGGEAELIHPQVAIINDEVSTLSHVLAETTGEA